MKTRVDILAVEKKEGRMKDSGKEYCNYICQCVCHLDKIQVGELVISDKLLPEGITPGSYIVEYGLNVNWQTKKLEGQLKSVTGMAPAGGSAPGVADGGKPGKAAVTA